MKNSKRPSITLPVYILLLSLFYALLLNFPLLRHFYSLSIESGVGFTISAPFLLVFAFAIVFVFTSIPYIFKPFLIFLTLTSSLAFFAALKYNIMFDLTMVENIFETNPGEATSYLNLTATLYFLITGIIPSFIIYYVKITPASTWYKGIFQRIIILSIALSGIALIATFFYKNYASTGRNHSYLNDMINPAFFVNSVRYLNIKYLSEKLTYRVIGDDAKLIPSNNKKPTLMIFVLGETARAQNSSYNGYERNTTPYTENLGMIAFQDVASCGTATAVSVPCMFSNMPRVHYNKARANAQDNLLDILTYAGVDVLWKDHDGGAKGVDKHITSIAVTNKDDPQSCNEGNCYDDILLKGLDHYIESNNKDKLITLHITGSHGPTYWLRYPPEMEKFKPSCNRSDIDKCSDQEIKNVYDNTLVYTDYFLAESIKLLKKYQNEYNVALMYMSDHGESLGEFGFYLHGSPYFTAPIYQRRVPWLIWMPTEYANAKSINRECVKGKTTQSELSQDNLFHTLLGFYGVETSAKDPKLDLIEGCKVHP